MVIGLRGLDGVHVTSLAVVGRGHRPARVTTLHQQRAVTIVLVLTAARTSVCLLRVQVSNVFILLNIFIYEVKRYNRKCNAFVVSGYTIHTFYTCIYTFSVHGGWSGWSDWGTCSSTCGVGLRRRDRSCDSPGPSKDGNHCNGDNINYDICIGADCHGKLFLLLSLVLRILVLVCFLDILMNT